MKILITDLNINATDFYDKYGRIANDPSKITVHSKNEIELLKKMGVTHTLDFSSFHLYTYTFLLKYRNLFREQSTDNTFLLNKKFFNIEPFQLHFYDKNDFLLSDFWNDTVPQIKNKHIVQLLNFLYEEVPSLTYHCYDMVFTRLNSTSYQEWCNSSLKIKGFLEQNAKFQLMFKDLIKNLRYEYDRDFNILWGYEQEKYPFYQKYKNSPISSNLVLIDALLHNIKTQFRIKSAKKNDIYYHNQKVFEVGTILKQQIMLISYFSEIAKLLKHFYSNDMFEGFDDNSNFQNTVIDHVENLNYRQFILESVVNRNQINTLDPLDVKEINLLKEHGLSLDDFENDLINYLMESTSLNIFMKYSRFDKFNRSVVLECVNLYKSYTLQKKLDDSNEIKELIGESINSIKRKKV